jgi:hypothetical protein
MPIGTPFPQAGNSADTKLRAVWAAATGGFVHIH